VEKFVSSISLGVSLAGFRTSLKQAMQSAASLRVDGIEIDARNDIRPSDVSASGIRQLRKMLSDLNLTVKAIRFPTRRGYDCAEEIDRRVSATKDAMKLAVELSCNVIVNAIGTIHESAEDNALLTEVMNDLAKHSYHYGCFMACETGTQSLQTLAGFIATLPEESVFIALNPSNLIAAGHTLDDLPVHSKMIRVAYANDCVPDRSRIGHATRVPLGQGIVDLPMMVGALEDSRVRVPYFVDGLSSADPLASCKQAVEFLRRM
jgi:sugar phosphate isomerase/epimerase